jgi:formate-dependent nitrite reductase membrane component NrfD
MKDQRTWGWPVIGYLFLGGLGGGVIIISSAADLFWGEGEQFALGSLLAGVILALGAGLLLFDLGRPLQFWRIFSRQKVIMTFGAWMLSALIVTSILYFSFWISFSPWRDLILVRQMLAWLNIVLGLGVCIYTGISLGHMKSRPFWNSQVLPILFLVSALSTGIAVQSLFVGDWPYSGIKGLEDTYALLKHFNIGILLLELIIIFVYVFMMRTSSGKEARIIAEGWLVGRKKLAFWGGIIGMGLLIPGGLYFITGIELSLISACILLGGLILRSLLVFSDERRKLPDEA